MTIQEKKKAIAEVIIDSATSITSLLRGIPKSGKNRNIFIKSYNRRPLRKRKIKQALFQTALKTIMTVNQIRIIQSQPTQKFTKGG